MKYLKLFEKHSDYVDYTQSEYPLPNVSWCIREVEAHFHKAERDYSKEYLTTEAIENGTISFNIWKSMGTEYITSISYSTDDGNTWRTINNANDKLANLAITVNVNEGDKVLWKGDAQQTAYYDNDKDDYVGSFFSSTAEFNVYGNVMSLLYGDNFYGENVLEYDGQFAYLFSDYGRENECKVVNAENLSLPATTLANDCYFSMFYGCTSLTAAPELPATTLANDCYMGMFNGCTSLNYIKAMFTTTPSLTYTSNWVNGVSSTGTFVKNSAATWDVTGNYGVPNGWTIETASA